MSSLSGFCAKNSAAASSEGKGFDESSVRSNVESSTMRTGFEEELLSVNFHPCIRQIGVGTKIPHRKRCASTCGKDSRVLPPRVLCLCDLFGYSCEPVPERFHVALCDGRIGCRTVVVADKYKGYLVALAPSPLPGHTLLRFLDEDAKHFRRRVGVLFVHAYAALGYLHRQQAQVSRHFDEEIYASCIFAIRCRDDIASPFL